MMVLLLACVRVAPVAVPVAPEVRWITSHLVPLDTTEPTAPLDDLVPLDGWLASRRIVAVGEATHGSREFFAFKHRLFRYLVERHGFTVLAMELPYDTGLALDDFVQGGPGDAHQLLHGSYWWVDSGEILALVEWMRSWNTGHPDRPVHLVGFDVQRPARSAEALQGLIEHPPEGVAAVLTAVRDGTLGRGDAEAAMATLSALREAGGTSQRAAGHLTIVEQALDTLRWCAPESDGCRSVKRDVHMAANVRAYVDQTGAKALVWAHNGHVAHAVHADGWHPMGELLRAEAGDPSEVASILLEFDQGGFVSQAGGLGQVGAARAVPHLSGREVATYALGPAPPEALASVFASVGRPLWFLDLTVGDPEMAAFFATHRNIQEYGGLPPSQPRHLSDRVVVPEAFDAVVFVARIGPYTFLE